MTIDLGPVLVAAKRVDKAWGAEYWITNNELYCAKILELNPGWQCSLHKHLAKDEEFIVLSGYVLLECNDFERHLYPGHRQRILPNSFHRFSSPEGAVILEISTTHRDADCIRKAESRKI